MYSTKCGSCRQLINLKPDEIRAAVDEAEAKKQKLYVMPCPKCGKQVKIQVSQLKLRLPRLAPSEPEETPSQ